MTRQINCVACGEKMKAYIGKYPGEDVRVIAGKAKREFVCDLCSEAIAKGQDCFAVSISTARTPYSPWEAREIEVAAEGGEA